MPKSPYSQIEEKILAFWKKEKIFERSVEERPEDKSYIFYDGPPFATGLPHYGHILSSVIKDLIPRYWTMKGYQVKRRWGWDCHGLPIETIVEKKLGVSGKKQIEEKGIGIFNETARSQVLSYVDQWRETVNRIGRWVDFENSYKTMDPTFIESVWWALKTIWDKGLIYEGRKVLMYCPRCETPVSNAEISMDNSYRDVTEDSIVVKFHLLPKQKFGRNYETKDSAFLLAWTTTPWTLPGNVALTVGEDIDYTALRMKGAAELYLVASKRIEEVFKGDEIEIVHNDLKGSDLVGLEYEPLYEIGAVRKSGKKAWYVTTADFVTTEDGTGIVHTAVIYGETDFELGSKINLPQVPLLDSSGVYNKDAPELLQGKFYKEAEDFIKKDLTERGLIFKIFPYSHSYPFCWRCEAPLIYNAVNAWFINIQKIKDRIIELNEKINWYPGYLKHGRFLNIIKSAPDWNISRNRYWATPLPFFVCENTDCSEKICIGSVAELKEKSVNFHEVFKSDRVEDLDLHRPYMDQIILKCTKCSGEMKRTPEVIDCWVESSSMPFAEWHYPFENKGIFEKRFPGQFIAEYIAQTRTWFYYMHTIAVMLFDDISYENVVSTGTILAEDGSKMSKSKGNYPDPEEVLETYGADALRFYLMSSVVMQADNLFFNEKDLREVYNKVINSSYNILSFFEIYRGGQLKAKPLYPKSLTILDLWVISKLNVLIKEVSEALEKYDTVQGARVIRTFVDDLSTWWVRRSRDRFKDETERESCLEVLRTVLNTFAKVAAPFMPFIAEHIWQKVKSEDDEISVHLSKWPVYERELISKELEEDMQLAREIVERGHAARSEAGIKVRQPLSQVSWNKNFKSNAEDFSKIILDELNVEIFSLVEQEGELKVDLDITIDDRLQHLGDLREIHRALQQARKLAGYKQGEPVSANYYSESSAVNNLIEENLDEIKQAAALGKFTSAKTKKNCLEVELSCGKLLIAVGD